MFKRYADDQVVRGILRFFPNGKDTMGGYGLDIGCGAGRHAKVMLDQGFSVKAVDIVPKNIEDTKKLLEQYEQSKLQLLCQNFMEMNEKDVFDLVIAWNILYAYNHTLTDCPDRICKIRDMMKKNGKLIMSLKSDEDSWRIHGVKKEGGIVDNPAYDIYGYVFYSQNEMVQMISDCGLKVEYFEKFTRQHTMEWTNVVTNEMWKNRNLEINEVWYAICASKV